MGALFSLFEPTATRPAPIPVPLLLFRAQYIGQPLSTVLTALRNRGIENIVVALKPRETWSPPPRISSGRVFIIYDADSQRVQDVVYE